MTDDDNRRELAALLPPETTVNFESMFPKLGGWFAHRRNKVRARLVLNARNVLQRFLGDDEEILYVTGATRHFKVVSLFAGWTRFYNRNTIVVTNERVLTIHTNRKGVPSLYANHISRRAIQNARASWLTGTLRLKFGTKSARFGYCPRRDAKTIANLLPDNTSAVGGQQYLCPSCGLASNEHGWPCTDCGADALSPKAAAVRSLVLRGLGDWMLGHRIPGVFGMLGSTVGWVILINFAVRLLIGGPHAPNFSLVSLWAMLLFVGHGINALVTLGQGHKGLYSVDGQLPTTPKPLTPVPTTVGGTTTPTAAR